MDYIPYLAAGINHMDWFLQYKVDEEDAYPMRLQRSKINVHVLMTKAMEEKKYRYIYEAVKMDPLQLLYWIRSNS